MKVRVWDVWQKTEIVRVGSVIRRVVFDHLDRNRSSQQFVSAQTLSPELRETKQTLPGKSGRFWSRHTEILGFLKAGISNFGNYGGYDIEFMAPSKWKFDMFNLANRTESVPIFSTNGGCALCARTFCLLPLHELPSPGHAYSKEARTQSRLFRDSCSDLRWSRYEFFNFPKIRQDENFHKS